MFWNVTFIYNAFIRTTDHCKVQLQTAFVSLFYIFINMKPWNASNFSVVVVGLLLIMLNGTLNANLLILPRPLGHLTNFLRIFTNFFNFGKIVKIREFFFCWGNEFSIYDLSPSLPWNALPVPCFGVVRIGSLRFLAEVLKFRLNQGFVVLCLSQPRHVLYSVLVILVVSSSAIDCLERFIFEMIFKWDVEPN